MGYKYNYFNKSMFAAMNECLKKALVETTDMDVKEVVPGTKVKTTPEEITQRAYSNTPRSQGDVKPEFKGEYDSAFQTQRRTFDSMSDEAKRQASIMWGDPRHPAYRTSSFDVTKVRYESPTLAGVAHGRDVTVSADNPQKEQGGKVLPHEMTHVQQFATQTDRSTIPEIKTDQDKPYGERKIEAGAESKAQVIDTRNRRSSGSSLEPLSDREVESALERTRSGTSTSSPYSAFDTLPDNIKKELKNYMKNMIVTPQTQTQGTMA
jgi:hypothetical protein